MIVTCHRKNREGENDMKHSKGTERHFEEPTCQRHEHDYESVH